MIRTLSLIAAGLLLTGRMAGAQQPTPTPTPAAAPAAAKPDSTKADSAKKLTARAARIAGGADRPLSRRSAAQTLVASTYPLEIVQLQQWLAKNPELKDKALADSVAKQPWDPSIQSMAAIPDVGQAPRRRHPVDDRAGQRLPRPAERRDGRRAGDAEEGEGQGRARVQRAAEGRDARSSRRRRHRRAVGEPRGHLRAVVQPDGGVRRADRIPTRRSTTRHYRPGAAFVSFGVGMMWGAAMWGGACCRYGWGGGGNVYINLQQQLQQHQRQQPEQHQQRQPGRQQLAAQPVASRRHPLRRPGHQQQVRR